jgi:hypothetical protein
MVFGHAEVCKKFEKLVYGMGLSKDMFAVNLKGTYTSPITRQLYEYYKRGELNSFVVNSLILDLK